jgi:hypothetical protein
VNPLGLFMKFAPAAAAAKAPPASSRAIGTVKADGMAVAYLVVIFVVTALMALLAATAVSQRKVEPSRIRFTIGVTTLDVPSTWLRAGMPRSGGTIERLDLVIPWPDEPTGEATATGGALAIEKVVLVALTSADSALAPAQRPARLYSRFLTGEVWPNPGGLILRRFRSGTPYEDEELYLSPPDGHAFAARCPRGVTTLPVREGCVAEIRVGQLDAQLRFAPARLVAWERLADGARRVIASMSVTAD